ncbi:MAG: apolipoprotein N-acyltransferase [bacterium]|nr:apolipoprotein N-acyltransferase [bacterium]
MREAFLGRVHGLPRWLWAIAFAVLLGLSFPFRMGDVQFDIGGVAGWLALVPFAWMIHGLAPRAAFRWGTLSGAAAYCFIVFWLYIVVYRFGGAPGLVGFLAVLIMALYVGLHVGLAGALSAWLEPIAGRFGLVVLPAAWVASEYLRTFDVFGGFPWAFLGYAPHADGPILELASLGGVWGLSFLLAFFAGLLARARATAAIALLCVAHLVGLGLRLWQLPEADAPLLKAALVQGNIAQNMKWDPKLAEDHFKLHLATSRMVAAEGVELILWPESAAGILVENQPHYALELQALARETGAVLVIGGVGINWSDPPADPSFSNSVFAVTPEAGIVDRYDKAQLVPFGEYIPLRAVLNFLSWLAPGLAGTSDLAPGPGPRVLNNLPSLQQNHAPAALICYEVIYPDLVRAAVRDGARLFLNLTNDAWYGRSSAPHQFLAIAATRSAEHGIPMLRAANTGVSAVVDPGGVVLKHTPIFEQWALPVDVPLARKQTTLYTMLGDWVVWLSGSFLIGMGGIGLVQRNRQSGSGREGEGVPRRTRGSRQARR